jgi:hypothetical protein
VDRPDSGGAGKIEDTDSDVDRRSMLRKVAVGAVAAAGVAVAGTGRASANAGDPVILGSPNASDSAYTQISASDRVLLLVSNGAGSSPVCAMIANGGQDAIEAVSYGAGRSGIYARNAGSASGFGVFGAAAVGIGVKGAAPIGVHGEGAGPNSVGVVASAPAGSTALNVAGVAKFSRSGIATIAGTSNTPKSQVVVPVAGLQPTSLVLGTVQSATAGVWVARAVPDVANSRVSIFLNKAATVSVRVAWFVVN